jgi:hypothetical protein
MTVSCLIYLITSISSKAAIVSRKKIIRTVAVHQITVILIYCLARKNLIRKIRLLAILVYTLVAR